MKSEGLAYFTDTYMTSAGLIIFFVFFIAMLAWIFRSSSTQTYKYAEQLPLKQDGE